MPVGKEGLRLWSLPVHHVFDFLKSSEQGLTAAEARRRLAQHGLNELGKPKGRSALHVFISQFTSPLILVLVVASFLAFILDSPINAIVIFTVVVLSGVLGFIQEYKAERALDELRKYVTLKTKVRRAGEVIEIDASELVPGDIVLLNIGDIVPADMRLVNIEEMTTDESSLTGESVPVIKKVTVVSSHHSMPHYLHNVAFMGTTIASGSGYGVVIATGEATFFGKTAASLKQEAPLGDFERSIREFSRFLVKVILGITLFVFIANAFLGRGVFNSFLFSLALAVGITPEVLPIIMTITLSRGAMRMARQKVIIKRLSSVEDLGNIDTLCCDKTGTLTEGKVALADYRDLTGQRDKDVLLSSLLCNTGVTSENSIDKALWESAKTKPLKKEASRYQLVDENEFDFERRRMSVICRGPTGLRLIAKGAPEAMLAVSTRAKLGKKTVAMTTALAKTIHDDVARYESQGYRVLAVASKPISKTRSTKHDENKLLLLGLLLFIDPPKSTAKEALRKLQELGVAIKVVSGDSTLVTRKICTDVGLMIVGDRVVSGEDLERMNEQEFTAVAINSNVFARVTPEQKHRIVLTLHSNGHVVGFLGDGVNDAPALKAADVGISVDTGAGIAKEAADVILLKKSLRTLAAGIKEGRKTFGNITKYILNTVSGNFGNMFTVALSSVFLPFIPLLPVQILVLNFLDDAGSLTISTDKVDPDFVRKPKRWDIKMISKFMLYFGLLSTAFDLLFIGFLHFYIHAPVDLFRTAWFIQSSMTQIIVFFAIRTRGPFYKSSPSAMIVCASAAAVLAGIALTYTTIGNTLFEFTPTPVPILGAAVLTAILYFFTVEFVKRHFFRATES